MLTIRKTIINGLASSKTADQMRATLIWRHQLEVRRLRRGNVILARRLRLRMRTVTSLGALGEYQFRIATLSHFTIPGQYSVWEQLNRPSSWIVGGRQ